METNELKKLIGCDCLVIDPRSKKKEFEPAKIISASFSVQTINRTDEIYEHISFGVELYKLTVTKRNRYGEVYRYNRSFNVSRDRIQIPNVVWQNEQPFCPYCGHEKSFKVATDINSGRICKNPLCKG